MNFLRLSSKMYAILGLIVLVGAGVIILSQNQIRQVLSGHAATVQWATSQSATTACNTTGTVTIFVSFTNEETTASMNVTAVDNQSNQSVNLGTVKAGQTKTGTIDTHKQSLGNGQVTFHLSWTNSSGGTDTRTANYSGITKCTAPTASPTPTAKITPSSTPTSQPTGTPIPSISVSPTACPTPGVVQNVHIQCPYCTPSPSQSP